MTDTLVKIFSKTEFGSKDANLLGGKGAHLAELHNLELPVPPLVNLTTDAYHQFTEHDDPDDVIAAYAKAVHQTFWFGEMKIGEEVLVSVRSGAPVSMPGMMDTILNVGLSLDTQEYWEDKFGPDWFWDSYSRLLIQLSEALNIPDLPKHEATKGFRNAQIVSGLLVKQGVVIEVLTSPIGALRVAIKAVFESWMTERAIYYREMNGIDHGIGTACSIQKMVFGNLDDQSGTGVMFTRNPSNGDNIVTGEFLVNAQGEDVVDGSTTPIPLKDLKQSTLPENIGKELFDIAEKLETHFLDMQDVEFTIEQGKLWVLQTRTAKRTSEAAFRIAVEMVEDDEIELEQIIEDQRLTIVDWHSVKGTSIKSAPSPSYTGMAAGSGVAQGRAVFSSEEAVEATDPVILVRPETTPDDIKGMYAAVGIVTFEGGMTSHAAVVARGMNKPCVVGVTSMAGKIYSGDVITIDSATGLIWVNAEVEISSRGASEYADKWVTMLQELNGTLATRSEYRPYSVLQVSTMSEANFEAMLIQVSEAGSWYDQVWLRVENIAPYFSDGSPLTTLAALSLPMTVGPMMEGRKEKLTALVHAVPGAQFTADCPIAQSVPGVIEADGMVEVDEDEWKQFLGDAMYAELKKKMIDEGAVNNVLNWVESEEVILGYLFNEGAS